MTALHIRSSVRTYILCFTAVLLLTSVPLFAQKADLSRLVVVGDSLSAGYQNSSLVSTSQVHGFAAVLAGQAGADLKLPLIAAPGAPAALHIVSLDPLIIDRLPGSTTGRLDPTQQTMALAVPGHFVADALNRRPDGAFTDPLTDLVLGLPGLYLGMSKSQVEWAEALQPTTVIVWLGNNDALWAAIDGDPNQLTPIANFHSDYKTVLDRLNATGATLITANIPDITAIPYLIPAETVAAQVGVPLAYIGPVLGIGPGDYVTLDGSSLIPGILMNPASGPLPGSAVVTAAEAATIHDYVVAYNQIIADEAALHGVPVVDINSLLSEIKRKGVVVGGQRLTADYLGGIFSLDGIHPTNTGYAVIANEFIKTMNRQFAAGIAPVSIVNIAKTDPLVLPGVGHPAKSLPKLTPESSQQFRAVFSRK